MSVNWQESLNLVAQIVQQPVFKAEDIERVRQLTLQGIKQEKARPVLSALRTLPPLLYGKDHPYAKPLTGSGTEQAVSQFTRDDLVNYAQTWLRPDNARVTVVGDIDLNTLTSSLEQAFSSWQAPSTAKPKVALYDVARPEQARVFIIDKPESPQSLIIAGLLGPNGESLDQESKVALEMMNTIIGGSFTSRLNMNLREDKGWSYGARTILQTPKGQGPFFAYAPVQTDKTKESIQEILAELNGYIGKKPATSTERSKVEANKVASLPGSYEKKGALLSALSSAYNNGDDINTIENYANVVKQTSLEDIQNKAKSLIAPQQLTWVIVGDVAKIKEEIESLNLGEVTYLEQ